MATISRLADQSVVLHDVSWQTYVNLLEDLVDRSAPRLTFDRGLLEIISPTKEHEASVLSEFVEKSRISTRPEFLKSLREWIRNARSGG